MLKKLHFKSWLLILCMLVGVGKAWATDFTLSSANQVTQDGITVSFAKGAGSNAPTWYDAGLRFYAKNTVTITVSSGNITNITFNWEKQGSKAFASATASSGEYSHPETTGDGVWSGSAQSVTFTLGDSGQLQLNTFSVTASGSGSVTEKVATPTFSPAAGAVSAGTEVTISTTTAGSTIYYTTDGSNPTTSSSQGNSVTVNDAMTIKAIAVKDGMGESDVATAEYTIRSNVSGFDIDFETNDVSSYIDWTFDNIGVHSDQITAHGGTYYGVNVNNNGNGVASASITTNNKVPNPGTFTCYISKESNNTTSSNWIVKVSSDKSTWEDVETKSATGMTKGEWQEFTADLSGYTNVYVQLNYSGSTAVRAVDDISLTMASGQTVSKPVFSVQEGTYTEAQTVELTCATADAKIYYTLDGTDPTSGSLEYAESITISETTTIKAIAIKDGISSSIASATYTISEVQEEDGTVTFDATKDKDNNNTTQGEGSITKEPITMSCSSGILGNGSEYRIYKNATLTLSATDANITKIEFTGTSSNPISNFGTHTGLETDGNNGTWTGSASSVTFTASAAQVRITKIIVTYGEGTAPTPYTSIADFVEAGTEADLDLTGAQVVFIDAGKKNIYVRDNSGAIDLFNSNGFETDLTTGDILNGTIHGTYRPYNNLPEIANITNISNLTATRNETVVAKEINAADFANYLCDLVKITNTEITLADDGKYYIADGEIQLYDNFKLGLTFEEGNADVSGIAIVYKTTYEIFPRYESDIVYLDNAVEVAISSVGYATFSSTNALDFTGADAIEAYIATQDGDNAVNFTRVRKVPANTGLLLHSAQGGAVETTNIPVLSGEADNVEGNVFVAVSEEITSLASEVDGNANYILNVVNDQVGFYKAAGKKVAAGKAYIKVPATTEVKSFALPDGSMTAINGIEAAKETGVIYNLAGQRVNKAVRGLYIMNGKKVLVK